MSMRALAVAALVVAGAVAALILALGSGDEPPAARDVPPAEPAAEAVAAPGRELAPVAAPADPATAARPRPPALPGKPPAMETTGVGDEPLWSAFDDESRDPSWATEQEAAIRERIDGLLDAANRGKPGAVSVPQVECREVHCRMLVTGFDQQAFMSFVESLQDPRGFYGDAALLALDGYGTQVDKKSGRQRHEVRVHLKYDR